MGRYGQAKDFRSPSCIVSFLHTTYTQAKRDKGKMSPFSFFSAAYHAKHKYHVTRGFRDQVLEELSLPDAEFSNAFTVTKQRHPMFI